jgi:hypothetical protein
VCPLRGTDRSGARTRAGRPGGARLLIKSESQIGNPTAEGFVLYRVMCDITRQLMRGSGRFRPA